MKHRAVFVHGAGGGGWEWTIWRRVFAAHGWTTAARDLLPADGDPARTRLDDYARQVEAWARGGAGEAARHAGGSILVGASLGGLLALLVAQRVEPAALVLINPLPPANVGPQRDRGIVPDIVPWGSSRVFASTRRAMPDADDAARLFAFRRWRDESGTVLREAQDARVEFPSCPLLVVASAADADVPWTASRALAECCNAEFIDLPGASHLGPLLGRNAASVAARCLEWAVRATAA